MPTFSFSNDRKICLGLFLIAISFYSMTAGYGFTFDDHHQIIDNPLVIGPTTIFQIFTTAAWPGDLYRPITIFSFRITYLLFGLNPLPFHLTNIILHALVSVLVFKVLQNFLSQFAAGIAALFFALHPVHIEVVANIWNRTEALSALFGLSTVWLMLRWAKLSHHSLKSITYLLVAALTFLLAVLAKESGLVILPLLALLLLAQNESKRRNLVALLCLSMTAVLYFLLRSAVDMGVQFDPAEISSLDNFLKSQSTGARILYAWMLLGRYITILIVPYPLFADYSFAHFRPIVDWYSSSILCSLGIASIALLLTAYWYAKRRREWIWGAWFFATFLVTANLLFPIGTIFAERLLYLPSVAICALLAQFLAQTRKRPLATIIVILICGAYTFIIINRAPVWSDDLSLWRTEADYQLNNVKAQHFYAYHLFMRGDYDQAAFHEKVALGVDPTFSPGLLLLQRAQQRSNRWQDAEETIQKLLTLQPNYAPAYDALGWVELGKGENARAKVNFEQALKLDPKFAASMIGLFAVAVSLGDVNLAESIADGLPPRARKDPRFIEFRKQLQKDK